MYLTRMANTVNFNYCRLIDENCNNFDNHVYNKEIAKEMGHSLINLFAKTEAYYI